MVTQYRASRLVAVEGGVAAVLWKIVRVLGSSVNREQSNIGGQDIVPNVRDTDTVGDDDLQLRLIARIIRELCFESENEYVHKKLLQGQLNANCPAVTLKCGFIVLCRRRDDEHTFTTIES